MAFVGGLERRGGGGFFGAYVNTDDRNADRYLVNIVQGGIGLPDESYYRDEKFADIRDRLPRPPREAAHARRLGRPGAAAAQQVLDVETRLAQGHWERAETRDVLKAYNLTTHRRAPRAWSPRCRSTPGPTPSARTRQTLAETIVRQPSYLQHLSTALEEVPLDDWKAWVAIRVVRSASPYLSSAFVEENFEFYGRTLQGTPELRARWKRGVAFVEGVGRRGRRRGVRRPALPAARQGDDGRPGREPPRGLPPQHRARSTG